MSSTTDPPAAARNCRRTINPDYSPLFSGKRSNQVCCAAFVIFCIAWIIFLPLYLRRPDCSEDGFQWVRYNTTSLFRKRYEESIKVRMLDKENRDPLLFNFADAQTACATEGSHLWRLFDGEEEWTAVLSHVQKNLTPSSPGWWLRVAKVGKCPGSKGRCEEEALRGKGALVEWTRGNYGPYFSRAVQSLNWQEDCLYVDPGSNFLWKASNCKNDPRQALCVKRECRAEN